MADCIRTLRVGTTYFGEYFLCFVGGSSTLPFHGRYSVFFCVFFACMSQLRSVRREKRFVFIFEFSFYLCVVLVLFPWRPPARLGRGEKIRPGDP